MRRRASLLARAYLEALRAADAAGAYRVLAQARERGMRLLDLYEWVITPAMHEVGRLWERGAITIADEHLATELTQRVLTALRAEGMGEPSEATRQEMPRAMLAAVQGEQHVLGLRMAADLVEDAGYETLYLGADVPTEDLLTAVESHSPDLLGLSVTMPELGPVLAETVRRAHRTRPGLDLLVGGQASASQRLREATPVKDLASLDERLHQRLS
ncbi:MAG TPA: B12-binding domain-containing protein [Solirubrobacterales bacterium]|nr:B12-binding domain-containing protein [Solirubrobacterales bacterium]